jgi:hypothetical protein
MAHFRFMFHQCYWQRPLNYLHLQLLTKTVQLCNLLKLMIAFFRNICLLGNMITSIAYQNPQHNEVRYIKGPL